MGHFFHSRLSVCQSPSNSVSRQASDKNAPTWFINSSLYKVWGIFFFLVNHWVWVKVVYLLTLLKLKNAEVFCDGCIIEIWLPDRHPCAQCSTFPSTAATCVSVWTLSLVTSALSRLSTCLSTLSLQINNKANVVTSPKEPVPTPSLVHCLPALLPVCLHDCLSGWLSICPYLQWDLSWLHSSVEFHTFLTLLLMVIVFFPQ